MELVQRAKNLILSPRSEWSVIEQETITTAGLYRSYVLPLAALGPIASFIAMSMIGVSLPFAGTAYRVPVDSAIMHAVLSYALTLVGVYLMALIINALAPTFGGMKEQNQALKVSVYSSTAAWIAAIFTLVPSLAILGITGLYSIYLLYAGLPLLMKSQKDKAIGYTVVVIVCAVVIFMVIGAITGALISTQVPQITIQ